MAIDKTLIRTMFTEERKTTSEIAAHFGTSSQNIHRYIKMLGLTREDGGKAAQMKSRIEDPNKDAYKKQGCTLEEWNMLRGMDEDYKQTPLAVYNTFKNNFNNSQPGGLFELSLMEWWKLWEDSGKWGLHKRNPAGMYILHCIDKTKPLTKDNAVIRPFGDVVREARTRAKKTK